MARPRKYPLTDVAEVEPQDGMFRMIVTTNAVTLGGDKVARNGDEVFVTEQQRQTLLFARNARDV